MILRRVNRYLIFLRYLLGAVGGLLITTHTSGGHIDTQTAAGALTILVIVAFAIAWVNIKRLQIDQHRKWMHRAINLMASIVTSTIILAIVLAIATATVAHIGVFAEVNDFPLLSYSSTTIANPLTLHSRRIGVSPTKFPMKNKLSEAFRTRAAPASHRISSPQRNGWLDEFTLLGWILNGVILYRQESVLHMFVVIHSHRKIIILCRLMSMPTVLVEENSDNPSICFTQKFATSWHNVEILFLPTQQAAVQEHLTTTMIATHM